MTTKDREAELAKRFNGTIEVEGAPVEVRGGFSVVDRELFMVSDDGVVVTDKDSNIVAMVVDGVAQKLTPAIINQLRRKGYVK